MFVCLTRTGNSKLSQKCCHNNETSKQRQRSFPESNQFLKQHNTFYFSLLLHLQADEAINLKRTVFHPTLINRLQTVWQPFKIKDLTFIKRDFAEISPSANLTWTFSIISTKPCTHPSGSICSVQIIFFPPVVITVINSFSCWWWLHFSYYLFFGPQSSDCPPQRSSVCCRSIRQWVNTTSAYWNASLDTRFETIKGYEITVYSF